MARPDWYEVFCPYPSCRGAFRLSHHPRTGEGLRCRICGKTFSFQPAYQQWKAQEIRRSIQPRPTVLSSRPTPAPMQIGWRGYFRGSLQQQWFVWSIVAIILAACVAGGVYAAFGPENTNQQNPAVNSPRPTPAVRPAVRGTPTLREYWDLAACLDLYARTEAAVAAGLSDEQIVVSMMRADGALSRYGLDDVLDHCTEVFKVGD